MATFVSTIKFTEQGIKSIKDTTKRAASIKATAKKMGVKVTNIFWTLGAYDGLVLLFFLFPYIAIHLVLRTANA